MMEEICVGKLLPNLDITLGNAEKKECADAMDNWNIAKSSELTLGLDVMKTSSVSEEENVAIIHRKIDNLHKPKIYKNKDGGFATGLDLLFEETSGILDKRAERFGLDKSVMPKPTISSLYESMGIDFKNRQSGKINNLRLNAVHVRGVNKLTTEEVFSYFQDYGPEFMEWINDCCCNVIWSDEIGSARAIIGLSKPLPDSMKHLPEKIKDIPKCSEDPDIQSLMLNDDEEIEKMDVDDIHKSLAIPVPPGFWRLAVPHSKARTILLRFATTDDKKIPGAEKRSEFYKEHGNPNYGGLKGIISSSRKQKVQAAANKWSVQNINNPSSSGVQSEPYVPKTQRNKPLRMRMYADDEELKMRRSWAKRKFQEPKASVHSRLGSKYTKDDLCHLGTNRDLDRDDTLDLRSKLKNLRSETNKERSRDDEESYYHAKKYNRIDDIKSESKSYYKRKHRSPLCVDSDYSNDSSNDDS